MFLFICAHAKSRKKSRIDISYFHSGWQYEAGSCFHFHQLFPGGRTGAKPSSCKKWSCNAKDISIKGLDRLKHQTIKARIPVRIYTSEKFPEYWPNDSPTNCSNVKNIKTNRTKIRTYKERNFDYSAWKSTNPFGSFIANDSAT